MTVDLYIWGSQGEETPTIDAECLAAITYLHHALTPSTSWRLIPSNEPSVSPAGHLPALHHDGSWVSGFASIIAYLRSKSLGHLDAPLTPLQKADASAYKAFLSSAVHPLLDLYLYVSAANWSGFTRPRLSSLIPFPLTWTVPPLLRSEAAARVENLGLSELDTDFDPSSGLHLSGKDALPETFRKHIPAMGKASVREGMTPEQRVAIKLHRLAEDSFGVLEEMMQDRDGAKSVSMLNAVNTVTSVDCLAYAYLAIARSAKVPRHFLKDYLEDHAPALVSFVDDIHQRSVSLGPLPWSDASVRPAAILAGQTLDSLVRHVPQIGDHYAQEVRIRAERGVQGMDERAASLALSLLAISAVAGYGYYAYKALQPFGSVYQSWTAPKTGTRLTSEFGALGSILNSALGH